MYAYRRDNQVVARTVDATSGEKREAGLGVEAEQDDEELSEIVTAARSGLLADVSKRLLESVVDPTRRATVADALRRAVATLE